MLKLYTWTTPNGYKVPIFLEEVGANYELIPVNLGKKEQMNPEFLAMNPNHKIPVLIDEDAEGGPLTIFESAAILEYLAEKFGKLMPQELHARYAAKEWLDFQIASVGPMFGQLNHFAKHAPEKIEYGIKRYTEESRRLLDVLNTRLSAVEYLAGEYSIADIAMWTWVDAIDGVNDISLDEFPHVARWLGVVGARPAVQSGLEKTDLACKPPQ